MWQVYRSLTFSCARVSFFCTLLAIFPAVTPLLPISAIAAPASPVASADNGAGRRCAPHSQPPAPAAPPAWALAPRRALEQLRGLTETERARGERASERASKRRGDPEREGPTGGGRGRGEGTSRGRVSAPSPPPPDTTLPFKGPIWDSDPHHPGGGSLEGGRWERGRGVVGGGGCGAGTPRTCWRFRLGVGTTYAVPGSAPPRS